MKLPKGVNPKYGIFTMDRDFAGKIIDQYTKVNVLKRVKSENEDCAIMVNGKTRVPIQNWSKSA